MIMVLDQRKKAETDFNRNLVLKTQFTYVFELTKQHKKYEVMGNPTTEK